MEQGVTSGTQATGDHIINGGRTGRLGRRRIGNKGGRGLGALAGLDRLGPAWGWRQTQTQTQPQPQTQEHGPWRWKPAPGIGVGPGACCHDRSVLQFCSILPVPGPNET